MSQVDLRTRILLSIAGGGLLVACGSSTSTGGGSTDGGTDASTQADGGPARDSAGGGTDATNLDAPNGSDAPADVSADTGSSDAQPDRISVRRPLLVGSSLRAAGATERSDWQLEDDAGEPTSLDPVTLAALAQAWLLDGCEEHASIAAFARFTMHLLAVGAPLAMIRESQRASLDEVEHARACFALARRYGGRARGPASLSLDGILPPVTLAEIAAITAEEGCVGETLGVLLAQEQLAKTTDPFVRRVLVRANMVADEQRHTELAWQFVSWAIAQGGEPVRQAVKRAIRRGVEATLATPIKRYPGIDVEAWRAHGRLTCEDARAIAEHGVHEIVAPCAVAMLRAASEQGALHLPASERARSFLAFSK